MDSPRTQEARGNAMNLESASQHVNAGDVSIMGDTSLYASAVRKKSSLVSSRCVPAHAHVAHKGGSVFG